MTLKLDERTYTYLMDRLAQIQACEGYVETKMALQNLEQEIYFANVV